MLFDRKERKKKNGESFGRAESGRRGSEGGRGTASAGPPSRRGSKLLRGLRCQRDPRGPDPARFPLLLLHRSPSSHGNKFNSILIVIVNTINCDYIL